LGTHGIIQKKEKIGNSRHWGKSSTLAKGDERLHRE